MKIVTTEYEGEVFNHRQIWLVATALRGHAKAIGQGAWHFDLPAMLMARLAAEAYANFLLDVLDPATFAAEKETFRSDIKAKINWIADRVGLVIDWGQRPFQRLIELGVLRDCIVHPKPEVYSGSIDHPADEDAPFMQPGELERLVSSNRAEGSLKDVEAVCDALRAAAIPVVDPKQRLRLQAKALQGMTAQATGTTSLNRPIWAAMAPRKPVDPEP